MPDKKAITRREFGAESAASAATLAAGACAADAAAGQDSAALAASAAERKDKGKKPAVKIGFHTDAFDSAYFDFDKCLQWAQQNAVHYIECGLIDGVSWALGLGYYPHVALYEDPLLLRRKMEGYGVRFSQVDAAYPLSGKDGPLRGVPYVMKAIAWADQAGSPRVDTTDGLHAPPGLKDDEAMDLMKRSYQQIIEVAEAHKIVVNIEPHGYFTTKPESDGPHARFLRQPLSANESGHGQHVHCRPGPGGLSGPVHRSAESRSREGRFAVAGGGHARQTDRHRRQSLRTGRRGECRQH